MKHFLFAAAFLSLFSLQVLHAQDKYSVQQVEKAIKSDGKYAVLVNTVQHLKGAIITGKEMKALHKNIEFHIVMCGVSVKELSEKTKLKQLVTEAANDGLTMLVCGMTLRNLKLSADLMPKEALLTENGLTYTFGLLELGFKVITL